MIQEYQDVSKVQNLAGNNHQSTDQANSNEVMTFYQTKRFNAVTIDTIEVEGEDEVQGNHYGKMTK